MSLSFLAGEATGVRRVSVEEGTLGATHPLVRSWYDIETHKVARLRVADSIESAPLRRFVCSPRRSQRWQWRAARRAPSTLSTQLTSWDAQRLRLFAIHAFDTCARSRTHTCKVSHPTLLPYLTHMGLPHMWINMYHTHVLS